MAHISDESRLLALPMELLIRTTTFLNSEVLTSLRLTCKTLEAATFDQYVAHYCTSRRCFVLSADRWTNLLSQFVQCPRLTRKVKQITLTIDTWECHDTHSVPVVPQEHLDFKSVQSALHAYVNNVHELGHNLNDDDSRPDRTLMRSVLHQLQLQSPAASVDLDLTGNLGDFEERYDFCRHLVGSILLNKLPIKVLRVSPAFTDALEAVFLRYRSDFLRCTSSLQEFEFGTGRTFDRSDSKAFTLKQLRFLTEIMQSAGDLNQLSISLQDSYRRHYKPRPELIAAKLLTSVGDPWVSRTHMRLLTSKMLTRLCLQDMPVSEDVLKNVLMSCMATLNHIDLTDIGLLNLRRGWAGIFQAIGDVAALEKLSLSDLHIDPVSRPRRRARILSFEPLKHGDKGKGQRGYRTVKMCGRDAVVAGVRELTTMPMKYEVRTYADET